MSNGFTFGGVHSGAFDIIVNKVIVPMTPAINNRLQSLGGVDGAWDYGYSYGTKEIEVDVTISGDSVAEMKTNARLLAGALNPRFGVKALVFDEEPNIQYFARLGNQIPLDKLGALGTFTIMFVCPDPFAYSMTPKSVTGTTSLAVIHSGTHFAKPVLTIVHGGGVGTVTNTRPDSVIETLTFTADSPAGTYVIDCKESTMTKGGERAYNDVKGDYFELATGTNTVTKTGNVTSVKVDYRDTWL